jgi:hypothetical protein
VSNQELESADQDSVYSMTFASESGNSSCYNSDAFESETEDGERLPDIVRKVSVGSAYSMHFDSDEEQGFTGVRFTGVRSRQMSVGSNYSMDFESDEERNFEEEGQTQFGRQVFESEEEDALKQQPVLLRRGSTGSTYSTDGFESEEDDNVAFHGDGDNILFTRERADSDSLSVYSDKFEEEDAEEVHVEEGIGINTMNLTISTGQEPEDEEAYCEDGHSVVIGGVIHRPLSPLKPAGIVCRSPTSTDVSKSPTAPSLFGHRPPLLMSTTAFKFADLLPSLLHSRVCEFAAESSSSGTQGRAEVARQWLHYWTNLHIASKCCDETLMETINSVLSVAPWSAAVRIGAPSLRAS